MNSYPFSIDSVGKVPVKIEQTDNVSVKDDWLFISLNSQHLLENKLKKITLRYNNKSFFAKYWFGYTCEGHIF